MDAVKPSLAVIHECPGCHTRINPNRTTCPDCWWRLPKGIRMAAVASWRTAAGSAERQRATEAVHAWFAAHNGEDRT